MIYSKTTPLDDAMYIGKIYSEEEINNAIDQYKVVPKLYVEIKLDQLEECLKFMSYNELNSRIRERLGDVYIIRGRFPEDIMLMKKEGV